MSRTVTSSPFGRLAAATAALALIAFGVLTFTATPISGASSLPTIDLHNDTAKSGTDCPSAPGDYWHFVLAPNNGSFAFVSISLNLGGADNYVVTMADGIIKNGSQSDNVFVKVPAGSTITSLVAAGSFATYTGAGTPSNFNLSHVCTGGGGSTTTSTSTTSTTQPTTTSTSTSTTSTTEAPTTTSTSTSTTQPATTSTSSSVLPTTTEAPSTTEAPTTTGQVGGVSTVPTTAKSAQVAGVQQVSPRGALPYTGSETGRLLIGGAAVLAGGALLTMIARKRQS